MRHRTGTPPVWEHQFVTSETPYVVLVDYHNGTHTEVGGRTQADAIARAKFKIMEGRHKVKSVVVSGPRGWVSGWGPGHDRSYRDVYGARRR